MASNAKRTETCFGLKYVLNVTVLRVAFLWRTLKFSFSHLQLQLLEEAKSSLSIRFKRCLALIFSVKAFDRLRQVGKVSLLNLQEQAQVRSVPFHIVAAWIEVLLSHKCFSVQFKRIWTSCTGCYYSLFPRLQGCWAYKDLHILRHCSHVSLRATPLHAK